MTNREHLRRAREFLDAENPNWRAEWRAALDERHPGWRSIALRVDLPDGTRVEFTFLANGGVEGEAGGDGTVVEEPL